MFSPQGGCSLGNVQYTPLTSRTPNETCKIRLEDKICQVQFELVEEAWDSQVLLEHLLALIQIVAGKQKTLKINIDHGLNLLVVLLDSSVTWTTMDGV